MNETMKLYNDDMFDVFSNIKPQSVDLLLTDFPYGTLNKKRNEWERLLIMINSGIMLILYVNLIVHL